MIIYKTVNWVMQMGNPETSGNFFVSFFFLVRTYTKINDPF